MGGNINRSGEPAGSQNIRRRYLSNDNMSINETEKKQGKDKDLIIEDNTIYEIDRECYERLKSKRRK
ncbi:MAG: hypothetical protein K0S76_2345 [Herbinix sp.]|nr:hypothetical protein [Herbinix sp.]